MKEKILYNVTVKVEKGIHEEWKKWMIEKHIPDVMATNLFESHKMSQLLGYDDSEGPTYAIQYVCHGPKEFEQYETEFASTLQKEHQERYRDKFVAFRTILKIINESKSKKITE